MADQSILLRFLRHPQLLTRVYAPPGVEGRTSASSLGV
jgi:hypothetical protein